MSTSASKATLFPAWKQEVNRRVAAHMGHKAPSAIEPKTRQESGPVSGSRAAKAAARVAERYAKAPSYNDLLADEARAAVLAAEAASRAAQDAHAAAQSILAGLEAASSPEQAWEHESNPEQSGSPQAAHSLEFVGNAVPEPRLGSSGSVSGVSSEPNRPAKPARPGSRGARKRKQRPAAKDVPLSSQQEPVLLASITESLNELPAGEAAQPIYANLIQFPREMVATRKMRPRRAEGPLAATTGEAQLSIFEVDPGSISTQPAVAADEPAAPEWMRAELSSIEAVSEPEEYLLEEPEPQAPPPARIQLASLSRRLMALVVDASFILVAFSGAAWLFASNARHVPVTRTAELAAVLALLAIGAAYQTLFFTLGKATPGMRYADIGLSTFSGSSPSRAQRCGRLLALPLSVLPLGLGLLWSVFDDGHLSWHDRLSNTYLRKR